MLVFTPYAFDLGNFCHVLVGLHLLFRLTGVPVILVFEIFMPPGLPDTAAFRAIAFVFL